MMERGGLITKAKYKKPAMMKIEENYYLSLDTLDDIMRIKELSATEKFVFLKICNHLYDISAPTQGEMADAIGVSIRSVSNTIRKLLEMEYITRTIEKTFLDDVGVYETQTTYMPGPNFKSYV